MRHFHNYHCVFGVCHSIEKRQLVIAVSVDPVLGGHEKMKFRFVACSFGLALMLASHAASAEDGTSQPANWDGYYAGLALGLSEATADTQANTIGGLNYFNTTDHGLIDPQGKRSLDATTLTGGALAGLNRQFGNIVAGLEADVTRSKFNEQYGSGPINYLTQPTHTFNVRTKVTSEWIVSVRPRVGYAQNNSLFFASAGPAMTRLNYDYYFSDTFNPLDTRVTESKFKLGWSAGAGYEHKFTDDWSVKAEYLHTRFTNILKQRHDINTRFGADGFNHKVDYVHNSVRIALVKSF